MTDPAASLPAIRRVSDVSTPHASRYLQQLCKHFQHKCPVDFDPRAGRIEFPDGECRLEAAGERLILYVLAADAARADRLQEVVERHLLRFAFREEIHLNHHPA